MKHIDPSHPTPGPASQLTRGSVLVVDTAPLSLITLAGVLHTQGYRCVCAANLSAAREAMETSSIDLVVWDVGDDAAGTLGQLKAIRHDRSTRTTDPLAAILIAGGQWAGLEKRTETLDSPTRCLFKPIDPHVLIAVVEQTLMLSPLVDAHQRKRSRPSRPGWVTLD
ncbi:MAG: hypothetical protein AAGA03_11400 [Planctomycetota bacterium]